MENNNDRVKALKDSIVEECCKQGFTLDEFCRLADSQRFCYERRKAELYKNAML